MNRYFEDARYHAQRASHNLALGVREQLEPIEAKLRELTGREENSEPTKLEQLRENVERVEWEARDRLRGIR